MTLWQWINSKRLSPGNQSNLQPHTGALFYKDAEARRLPHPPQQLLRCLTHVSASRFFSAEPRAQTATVVIVTAVAGPFFGQEIGQRCRCAQFLADPTQKANYQNPITNMTQLIPESCAAVEINISGSG